MTSLSTAVSRGPGLELRCLVAALVVSVVAVGIVPSPAEAAKGKAAKEPADSREMQAREAFAAGNYRDALDIYTKLYAVKLHPTYLRNIGRCYQNLGDPEHAIPSFREYLRKAKDMSAAERAEVDGFIKEMEDLQKKNAAVAAPPVVPPQPLPVAPAPVAPPPIVLVEQPAPAPAPAPAPFYKRAWFWGVVGGVVVAATAGGLWAGGVFSAKSNNACPGTYDCGR